MQDSHDPAAQPAMPPEAGELLAAVRDALDPAGLDRDAMTRRMVSVRVYLQTVLSGAEIDARHPHIAARWPERMTEAAELLRELGGDR